MRGEDVYEGGVIVSYDGAWLAGKDGASPGLIMAGTFLLGSRYFQEVALPRARAVVYPGRAGDPAQTQ